jgi:glycosyltransferase involved in cell wall biosynthesis
MSQFKYIDLVLYSLEGQTDVEGIINAQSHSLGYLNYLNNNIETTVIRLCGINKSLTKGNIKYEFIKEKNHKWRLHAKLFYQFRKHKPDAILVHSFMFAWQIIILRIFVGWKTKILVQNHAETPFKSLKYVLQKIAFKLIDVYFLVSFDQADVWIKKGVFDSTKKIKEMMEGSTFFSFKDKEDSKKDINFSGKNLFLWCGSLNTNKDPLTILNAFSAYRKSALDSYLYMIFNSVNLIDEVKQNIEENKLNEHVLLLGQLPHPELEKYYRAADYFILGSHHEGSGFSLCEAMACGCIPIVTNIPSFKKMTSNGECGYLFSPENTEELTSILMNLPKSGKTTLTQKVLHQFERALSFKAIAAILEKEIKN